MIEEEIALARRGEIGETAGYPAGAFGVLMGEGGVELSASGDPGRGCCGFPAAYAGTSDGEREKNIGVAEHVVIEEVFRAGAEVGNLEGPPVKRDGETEFVLLVALTAQWQEAKALLGRLVESRTGYRKQRRSLIVA